MRSERLIGIGERRTCRAAWFVLPLVTALSLCGQEAAPKPSVPAMPVRPPAIKSLPGLPSTVPGTVKPPATSAPSPYPAAPRTPAVANPAAPIRNVAPRNYPAPSPRVNETRLPSGAIVRRDQGGRVTGVVRGDMNVHRNLAGAREIRVERANGSRIVVEPGNRGYIQRRFMVGQREMVYRTFYSPHGTPYERFYRPYNYRGVPIEVYAPLRYYPSPFYGYVYSLSSFPAPVAYVWPGTPAAVYYGPYFTPYATYPAPAYWLTDYTVSTSLAQSYQAQLDTANGAPPPDLEQTTAPITPEIKQRISEEVRRQVALENTEAMQSLRNTEVDPASSGIDRMFRDNSTHVLVAGSDLDLLNAAGQSCLLSPGDVIALSAPPPPNAASANLVVMASKARDCAKGDTVSVSFADLQEMQNHMRETIRQGMSVLQSSNGSDGLPVPPAPARAPAVEAPFAPIAPPPDPNVDSQIAQQVREADAAEREAGIQPAAGRPFKPGDTIEQIKAFLGEPIAPPLDRGNGITVYQFPYLQVTFKDGKLIDSK
jgi:hypothetical protein